MLLNLKVSLSIITTNNSNGYDIDAISHSGTTVTAELLLDAQFNIPVTTGFASTETKLPFAIGDKVFVEGCRLKPSSVLVRRRQTSTLLIMTHLSTQLLV